MNIRDLIKETKKTIKMISEDYHHIAKEYRLYEGDTHIIAKFDDSSKLMFEVHFRNNHGPDREKHRKKAFTKWKSLANEIHRDVQLTEAGNPIEKSWKQSFQEALKHPELQEYIRHSPHHKVFPDKGYPAKEVQKKQTTCVDPVNFTPRV